MRLTQALQGLADTAQIKASSGSGIYSDSNKPTGVLKSLRMGFSAIFRSKAEDNSFREGYNAALRIVREDPTLSSGAASRFESQFGSRYDTASPLTVARLKSFLAVEHALQTNEIASRLEAFEQKIPQLSGDTFQLLETLDDLRSLRESVPSGSPAAKEQLEKINTLGHGIECSLGIASPDRSSDSSQAINSGSSEQAAVLLKRAEELGPKVANLQGKVDHFGEVLTEIYETSIQSRKCNAGSQTDDQLDSAITYLLKNFGILDKNAKPGPGLTSDHLQAIITWATVQANRSIAEKNGTPLSAEGEALLQQKESTAYKVFEEVLSSYHDQRQTVLAAGAEIRQNIEKGINLPHSDYGFYHNTPQLQQKTAEVFEKLLSTRKQGDENFEFDPS